MMRRVTNLIFLDDLSDLGASQRQYAFFQPSRVQITATSTYFERVAPPVSLSLTGNGVVEASAFQIRQRHSLFKAMPELDVTLTNNTSVTLLVTGISELDRCHELFRDDSGRHTWYF